jgi:hypothetical protein
MSAAFRLVASVLLGAPLGWFLLVGFCSVPGLAESVACGHNAFIWLPVFVPAGIAVCWFVLRALFMSLASKRRSSGARGDA